MFLLRRRLFLIFTLVYLTCGCAGDRPPAYDANKANIINNIMDSWVGHYQTELVAAWGRPTKVVPNEGGGQTLFYESLKGTWGESKDKRVVGGAQFKTEPRQEGYVAIREFYVDRNGIINSWKWEGL